MRTIVRIWAGIAFALATAVAAADATQAIPSAAVPAERKLDNIPVVVAVVDGHQLTGDPLDGKLVALTNETNDAWCDFQEFDCAPVWTGRVGAVILDRSKPEGDVIARPAGGLIAVSAGGDFDFDWSGGVDVYLARETSGVGVEVRFFQVDFNSAFDYGDTGDLEIGHTSVLNLFDVDAAYDSQLYSTEVNVRVPTSQRVTWLAGFRWVELQEKLNYDIDLLSLVNNDFRWNTDNHLYGGQMGVDLRLWDLESPLSINSSLKAGVYGNDAENNFRYRVNNFSILQGGAAESNVAFVGDIGVNLSYQVTRHFALLGGYQLLWINGAALASDQAAYTLQQLDLDVVTTQGDVFYHGALTGALVTW
ncbi:MAG: BBP7 family outer membrane beta-barrel protein [Pirellulales bacterium]